MRFAFIEAERAFFPIAAMCRFLDVTRQGFHAFVKRPLSPRKREEAALRKRIEAVYVASRGRYGSPRVRHSLAREDVRVSKRRVERAMREMRLRARGKRRFRVTTASNPKHSVEPNLLARDFVASRPNERWVTDITYIWTAEGWSYLAAIIDLYSRAVVGWALDTTLSTDLPLAALDKAVRGRKPPAGLVHHSDRGCQFDKSSQNSASSSA